MTTKQFNEESDDDLDTEKYVTAIHDGRNIGLFGPVDGVSSPTILSGFISLLESKERYGEEVSELPGVKFYISTGGGGVEDLFAIYDMMNIVLGSGFKINTIGLGHVKSAGVPLIANGTPGMRVAGANCRFMLHSVGGGSSGILNDIKTDIRELEWAQERYIDILLEKTHLTKREMRKIVKANANYFFDSKRALELGIIDAIL